MSDEFTCLENLISLKSGIEAATGESYNDLTEAVQVLKDGYGQGDDDILGRFLTKTLIHIKSERLEQLPEAGWFEDNKELVTADLPNVTTPRDRTFKNCEKLESVNLPKATYVGANAHDNNKSLTRLNFPNAATVYTESFRNATKLELVDFGVTTNFARSNAFAGCYALKTLILRGNEVSTLANVNNFEGGYQFTTYVPSALIEAYKTATNWSALYTSGKCNFVAIEGSEYE